MKPQACRFLPLLVFTATGIFSCAARAEESPHHKFSEEPHNYYNRELRDNFTKVLAKISAGELKLDSTSEKSQITSLLKALDVPASSQLLVYSATSFQGGLIRPANPRALYFNEEVYVGFVPGGRFEVAAIDPELGPVFRIFRPTPDGKPEIIRSERCMNCHAGRTSWQVPGLVVESVICTNTGASLDGFRREQVGHTIPLADRFGGWHITGAHEHADHLGNLMGEAAPGGYKRIKDPPGSLFDWNHYPVSTSDMFAHLIHEHQLGFHNLVTLGVYRTRDALAAGHGHLSVDDEKALNDIARKLVRYVLFANEARLPNGGLKPEPEFMKAFLDRRKPIANGASLRDLELRNRLFRYRCSYMVQTPSFAAMPKEFKDRVLAGIATALREQGAPEEFNYLPPDEKRAIRILLHEAKVGTF